VINGSTNAYLRGLLGLGGDDTGDDEGDMLPGLKGKKALDAPDSATPAALTPPTPATPAKEGELTPAAFAGLQAAAKRLAGSSPAAPGYKAPPVQPIDIGGITSAFQQDASIPRIGRQAVVGSGQQAMNAINSQVAEIAGVPAAASLTAEGSNQAAAANQRAHAIARQVANLSPGSDASASAAAHMLAAGMRPEFVAHAISLMDAPPAQPAPVRRPTPTVVLGPPKKKPPFDDEEASQ
jgi:hypothetical protein